MNTATGNDKGKESMTCEVVRIMRSIEHCTTVKYLVWHCYQRRRMVSHGTPET